MTTITTLIVEDDPKIAEIQRVFTEKIEGYSVVAIAHSLQEAEELVDILEPDLILLDIFFPDGNGLDLLWKIRASNSRSDIILITAAKEVEFFEQGMRGGVFDYILKPLVFNRFAATLDKYRTHRQKLERLQQLSQLDVDRMLGKGSEASKESEELPKGIDPITLEKITSLMKQAGNKGMSAENAGKAIGVSRTTSRRYLEYLVSNGTVAADLDYKSQGRPERLYTLKDTKTA